MHSSRFSVHLDGGGVKSTVEKKRKWGKEDQNLSVHLDGGGVKSTVEKKRKSGKEDQNLSVHLDGEVKTNGSTVQKKTLSRKHNTKNLINKIPVEKAPCRSRKDLTNSFGQPQEQGGVKTRRQSVKTLSNSSAPQPSTKHNTKNVIPDSNKIPVEKAPRRSRKPLGDLPNSFGQPQERGGVKTRGQRQKESMKTLSKPSALQPSTKHNPKNLIPDSNKIPVTGRSRKDLTNSVVKKRGQLSNSSALQPSNTNTKNVIPDSNKLLPVEKPPQVTNSFGQQQEQGVVKEKESIALVDEEEEWSIWQHNHELCIQSNRVDLDWDWKFREQFLADEASSSQSGSPILIPSSDFSPSPILRKNYCTFAEMKPEDCWVEVFRLEDLCSTLDLV